MKSLFHPKFPGKRGLIEVPYIAAGCSGRTAVGGPIDVFNHGQMVRDFTYIDDIVEARGRKMREEKRCALR
jgi:dTDP-D-glucose 4,6-dehydratase